MTPKPENPCKKCALCCGPQRYLKIVPGQNINCHCLLSPRIINIAINCHHLLFLPLVNCNSYFVSQELLKNGRVKAPSAFIVKVKF